MTVGRAAGQDVEVLTFALVDDDPAQHVMMAMAIKNADVSASLASFYSGEALLEALDDSSRPPFRPDVIVLDLRMPGLGGYGTLDRLQAHPEHWAIPVVVFTSSDRPAERALSLERGARIFQPKPSKLSQLESLVFGLPLLVLADRAAGADARRGSLREPTPSS